VGKLSQGAGDPTGACRREKSVRVVRCSRAVVALLAAVSAALFGAADFIGGLSARRLSAQVTTAMAQSTGLAVVLGAALVVRGTASAGDLAWGASAGVGGGLGILLLYWAFTVGPMSVVAPLSAAVSAAVPVVAGIAMGERPGMIATVGVCLALPAVVLIGRQEGADDTPTDTRRALTATIAAGLCFGWLLISLSRTSSASGMWPLVTGRATSAGLLVVIALAFRASRRGIQRDAGAAGLAVAAGVTDSLAFTGLLVATRSGLLSLVGVISALYPASTIVLARLLLHERLSRAQVAGLCLAGVAMVLIAAE
jgi:drug/metabolite transporter (DMT)-like permease